MSWTLFKININSNRIIWLIMTAVFCMYLGIITSMFDPEGAQAIQDMLKMLPEGLISALGFSDLGSTLTEFVTNYLYGFLVFLIPMVISIVVNHSLIAAHVDKGSMAYLLSTPNSRLKIARTQALFSLTAITAFFVVITMFGVLMAQSIFPGELDVGKFVGVNFYALITYFALGGLGFFASCIANENRHSLGIGIGLPVAFLVLQMLGSAGEKFSWVGNLSLYALFDPNALLDGSNFAYLGMAVLALLAAVLYVSGIYIFDKRNLHV